MSGKLSRGELSYPTDHGCRLHPKCLECPEPKCVYDLPEGVAFHQGRDLELVNAVKHLTAIGTSSAETAAQLGLSIRTVQRYLLS